MRRLVGALLDLTGCAVLVAFAAWLTVFVWKCFAT
jgi:hypothetical protein